MQFDELTGAEQTLFEGYQASRVREPTVSVWISGIDNPTNYIYSIVIDRAIESARGFGHINVGTAILTASNQDDFFIANGVSNIQMNAQIKIWAGFDNLNIIQFTGVVNAIEPIIDTDRIILYCRDFFGLFLGEYGSDEESTFNVTVKTILENMLTIVGYDIQDNITETDETTATLSNPRFEEQQLIQSAEELSMSIFHVPFFDESGTLQFYEREYSSTADWIFTNNNVTDCHYLKDSEIINSVDIEYRDWFQIRKQNSDSVNEYRLRHRRKRILQLNDNLVSTKTGGSTTEDLDNNLEAIKFTSASDSSIIDTVAIKVKQTSASGYMTIKIYDDSGGSPNTLLGTSRLKASGLLNTGFAWEYFYFDDPITISPSTDHHIVIDTTPVGSGSVELQISGTEWSAKHSYYSGGWVNEDDKYGLHIIYGSRPAQRLAEDVVEFYSYPAQRIQIAGPAVPQLQLLDKVLVDLTIPYIVLGKYVIEGRRTEITPSLFTTADTMRKAG